MTRPWQIERERFSSLEEGKAYSIFNCGNLAIKGIFQGYKKGRYFFSNQDGMFSVNIHAMKSPEYLLEE